MSQCNDKEYRGCLRFKWMASMVIPFCSSARCPCCPNVNSYCVSTL